MRLRASPPDLAQTLFRAWREDAIPGAADRELARWAASVLMGAGRCPVNRSDPVVPAFFAQYTTHRAYPRV